MVVRGMSTSLLPSLVRTVRHGIRACQPSANTLLKGEFRSIPVGCVRLNCELLAGMFQSRFPRQKSEGLLNYPFILSSIASKQFSQAK